MNLFTSNGIIHAVLLKNPLSFNSGLKNCWAGKVLVVVRKAAG